MPAPKRNPNMLYPDMRVPDVAAAPAEGTRYTDLAPDTYDIAERAKLALYSIVRLTIPEADYEPYFVSTFGSIPPLATYTYDNAICQYKVIESLALLREVTGETEGLEVDQRWKELAVQRIGPDGLPYYPITGRPFGDAVKDSTDSIIGALKDPGKGIFATTVMAAKFAYTLLLYEREDHDPRWRALALKVVDGLAAVSVYKDDYAYLTAHARSPEFPVPWAETRVSADNPNEHVTQAAGGWQKNADVDIPSVLAGYHCWNILALAQIYEITGYEPALDLGARYARMVMRSGIFKADGTFDRFVHFHLHAASLAGIARVARLTNDKAMAAFALRGYRAGVRGGDTLVGFFPEGQRMPNGRYASPGSVVSGYEPMETCELADMLLAAFELADLGHDECWDDADRWIRNQFAEAQITRTDWITERLESANFPKVAPDAASTGDRVAERNLGNFASLCGPSSFIDESGHGDAIALCCQGNGTRAVFHVWKRILDFENGHLRVNLCLNRASEWADVHSRLPYEGRVDVIVKRDVCLSLRVPGWANLSDARLSVNGEPRAIDFEGRYAIVGAVRAGDMASVTFPIAERIEKTYIGGKPFTLRVKGADAVDIEPRGKWGGFYQRERYREDQARWVERERFTPIRETKP